VSESKEIEKKSLVTRIAEACDAVKGIDKGGYNEMQRYKYVKAADVAKAIRHEFFSRRVVLVVDEKEYTKLRDVPTKSGGVMPEYLLKCEVTFYDGYSADKLGPFGAFGVAMDSGDKAIYKAKTGCLKYVLRTIGLIPDEKDDPEADASVDENVVTSAMDPNDVVEQCEWIANAKDLPELQKLFGNAYKQAANISDRNAQAKFIQAKDARKKELQ
jgi:hypothetical protein